MEIAVSRMYHMYYEKILYPATRKTFSDKLILSYCYLYFSACDMVRAANVVILTPKVCSGVMFRSRRTAFPALRSEHTLAWKTPTTEPPRGPPDVLYSGKTILSI